MTARQAAHPERDAFEPSGRVGRAHDRLRAGMIGVGRYASGYHLPHLIANQDVELCAICDASPARLAEAAARAPNARTFAGHLEMLDAVRPDAVTVSTPHGLHYAQVRDALERGAHVLVDKPFVLRGAEAIELVRLAAARERVLMVALNRHLDPANLYARELIQSGALGRVSLARSLQVGYPSTSFYADPALAGGGPLVGRGTHMAALMPWLTGWRPQQVSAVLSPSGDAAGLAGAVDDGAAVSIGFAGGALGQIVSVRHGHRNVDEMAVFGTEGSALVERVPGRPGWIVRHFRPGGPADGVVPESALPAGRTTTDHFVDAVLGRTAPRIPLIDGVLSAQIVEAAYESARTGRTVTLEALE
jgi:predicted dehydrogenase